MEKDRGHKDYQEGDNYVIVIGRQFGSGGRTIGKKIAKILGIDYYDTEILNKAAEAEGVDPKMFRHLDEKKPNVLKVLLQGIYGIADNFHTVPISGERIYNIQSRIIRDLAGRGSCVIVGRNADFILRDHPRLVSVFLHAPRSKRVEKIIKRKEAENEEEALELINRHDHRRESFYNFYTGEKLWGVASNYHLSLDTSSLDEDYIAEIIIKLLQTRLNK